MKIALRITAFLEGLSYVLLLFVGVPLKYLAGNDFLVKGLGMPHGLLFMGYFALAVYAYTESSWTKKDLFLILLASIIPFGTFWADKKYFKSL